MQTATLTSTTLLLLTASVLIGLPDVFGQQQDSLDRQSRLDELLNQRRDKLTRALDMRFHQYASGVCSIEEVLDAWQRLQGAELDAAATQEARIAVLRKQLEVAESVAKLAEQKFQHGAVSEVDVLLVQAVRLSIAIGLLREEDRVATKDE